MLNIPEKRWDKMNRDLKEARTFLAKMKRENAALKAKNINYQDQIFKKE